MPILKASTFNAVLDSTISISDLTRTGAKKIFDNIKFDSTKVILKNNKPIAALVSTERMQELLEAEENAQLLSIALTRLSDSQEYVTKEEFFKECNIDEATLQDLPEVEME